MPPLSTPSRTAPLALPSDVAAHLQRFRLALPDLLTADNPKTAKGSAVAHSVILHHLPGRSLAAAVTPGSRGATPCFCHGIQRPI